MKKIKLIFIFQLLSLVLLAQQNHFNIPKEFDLKILLSKNSNMSLDSIKYGFIPRYNRYNRYNFSSFYYMYINNKRIIDTLKFTKGDNNIGFKGETPAAVNIEFYGVSPKNINNYILVNHHIKNKSVQVPELIKELILSKKFIKCDNYNNIKLIIVKVWEKQGSDNPNKYYKNLGIKPLSRFIYVLWDTIAKKDPPKIMQDFENYCYCFPLFKTIKKDKPQVYNNLENENFDQKKLKIIIRNYFKKNMGIAILNNDFLLKIETDEIILYGLMTNSSKPLPEPYHLPLEFTSINIKIFPIKDTKSPETKILLQKIKNDIIFDLNGITNINNANIKYDPSIDYLQYPKIYSDSDEIIIKPKNGKNYFTISDKPKFYNDTLFIPVYFKKRTLILNVVNPDGEKLNLNRNYYYIKVFFDKQLIKEIPFNNKITGLYSHPDIHYKLTIKPMNNFFSTKDTFFEISNNDFKISPKIILKPEYTNNYVELIESKKYNHNLKSPDTSKILINYSKNKDIPDFELPDTLNNYWTIINNKIKKYLKLKKIPISRKVIEKKISIGLYGKKPDKKINYEIIAFNPKESKKDKIKTSKNNKLLFQLEFPPKPFRGDSIKFIFEKPYGYNITKNDTFNLSYKWEKPKIILSYPGKNKYNLIFTNLKPLQVFYIDISNSFDKPCFIKLLKKKIEDCLNNKDDFLIYISNSYNPTIINSNSLKDYNKVLLTISQMNSIIPNGKYDEEKLSNVIISNRRSIVLNFLLSKQFFKYKDELINGILKNLYNLNMQKNASRYVTTTKLLEKINKKNNNVLVNMYLNKMNNSLINKVHKSNFYKLNFLDNK